MSRTVLCLAVATATLLPRAEAVGQRPGIGSDRGVRTSVDERVVRAEYAGVLLQSGRYEEAANEYLALLAQDSTSAPWRLGLARAYAWGGRGRDAEREILRLMAARPDSVLWSLLRVSRSAIRDATLAEISEWMTDDPGWTPYRRMRIAVLLGHRRYAEALPHIDTLIAGSPDPALVAERGAVHAWMGEFNAAEQDLLQALAVREEPDWYALLGDVRRWRGRWQGARDAYTRALELAPAHAGATAGLAALDEEERASLRSASTIAQPGWRSRSTWLEDNAGFLLLSTGLSYGRSFGPMTVVTVGVDQRRISHRSHSDVERWITGWIADAAVSHTTGRITLDARAGISHHALAGTIPVAQLDIGAWLAPARLTASFSREPLYARLMSTRSLVEWSNGALVAAEALEGRSISASASLPVRDAELWVSVERLLVSDGNERRSASLGARYALAPAWTLLYSGGRLHFAERSSLYWDPRSYMSHALGAEWTWRPVTGMSARGRILQGFGWSSEAFVLEADSSASFHSSRVPQLTLGADVSWRRAPWEASGRVGYSRGRAGGYQSIEGVLTVRLDWRALTDRDASPVAGGSAP